MYVSEQYDVVLR